jgi:predicted dehydrogenase
MIGVWGRAYYLKDHLHRPDGESVIVAGSDVSDFALEKFTEYAGPDALATKDYRELLKRDDLDAVIVCTPDKFHEEHAAAALEAGHHIYLEKPMAITTEGCDRICAAAENNDRKLMMGFPLRYSPVVAKAKSLIDEGVIGEVKAVWMRHFVGYGSDFYFHDWHSRRENVNSLMLQKASHDLDVMHWLAGSYAEAAAGFGGLDMFGGDKPNDRVCDTTCVERDGCAEAQPLGDRFGLPYPRRQCAFREEIDTERNYAIIGTLGRLEIKLHEAKLALMKRPHNQVFDDIAGHTSVMEIDPKTLEGGHGGSDPKIAQGFLDYLLRDLPPRATMLDGRMSVAAGCAATESIRRGGVQTVPPPQGWTSTAC